MAQVNSISQDLADLLVTRNFDPEYKNKSGDCGPNDATSMSFDYVSSTGKNYGTAVAVIGDDNDLMLFFGDNLGRGMEEPDKSEWYEFINQLSDFATGHRYTWSPRDINQLKHTMAGIAAIKEGLFEGYYGTRRVSYMGEQTQARLVINHNRMIGEDDKRYRYIESIFIETADGERFKLQSNRLAHGRAMLEHVRQGGRPYDVRGSHINEMVNEIAVLGRFNRARHNHVYEGVTQEIVESAAHYYKSLQESLKHLATPRGYQAYFESWAPDHVGEQEGLVEDLRTMFIEQTLDTRIEAALPTLAKIQQQGIKMKEAQIFENWINTLAEGTWALPDTPEAQEKLNQLMSAELIVGPDATNATELLYDVIGDDQLFDILNDLAERDPRANIWDDSDVQARLAELGIQTPQSTEAEPRDVAQDTAPEEEQGVAEGEIERQHGDIKPWAYWGYPERVAKKLYQIHRGAPIDKSAIVQLWKQDGPDRMTKFMLKPDVAAILSAYEQMSDQGPMFKQGMAEGDNMATFVESDDLAHILKHAGVPVSEGVLNDDTGNTWDHLIDRFRHEVEQFKQGGELDSDLYDALFDYYNQHGAMPYGVAKARTGDPYNWVSERLAADLGLDEGWKGALAGGLAGSALGSVVPALGTALGGLAGAYAGHKLGDEGFKDPDAEYKARQKQQQQQPKPVAEGSCNMTAEGEYCPEHGLAECGTGGDPMNSNSAITSAFYESQEGDALLARIKSLALIK